MNAPTPDLIRQARATLGMSQTALARAIGGSLRAVAYWEAAERVPPAYLGLALAALIAHRRGEFILPVGMLRASLDPPELAEYLNAINE